MPLIKILAVGDVVGEGGVSYLSGGRLRSIQSRLGAVFTVVNGENSSKANCITPESAEALFEAGADVITGGNHTFKRKNIYDYLDENPKCIRPANYPSDAPGQGWVIADCMGFRILVINLLGTTFMEPLDSPFKVADRILEETKGRWDAALLDIHAEATSEKLCMGRYLDGRVSAVFGTHTHVQTADAQVLPGGTAYITDLGMCGPENSVLGVEPEAIIRSLRTGMPTRFTESEAPSFICGCIFEIDDKSGKAISAQSICIR